MNASQPRSQRPTRASLLRQLRRLGVQSGATLMVHVSLRRLGLAHSQVGPGGPELLLNALDEAVGPSGTLLMVLGTECPTEWVHAHPPDARAALLAGAAPFDYHAAPALAEVGWFAEVLRRAPGTRISNNPSGRFAARGGQAEWLLADQPWDDYYGPGSPLDKLCQLGGAVLRLGADPETVTVLHHAEYLALLPHKRRTQWDYVVADSNGRPHHRVVSCLDDANGIADWDGDDYFAEILRQYRASTPIRRARVGRTTAELLDAADYVAFGTRWMEQHLQPTA